MTRRFFVGGNFKMNPCSQEEKLALIEVLNEADLDPLTGTQGKLIHWIFLRKNRFRGHIGTPVTVSYSATGDIKKGYQGFSTESLQ